MHPAPPLVVALVAVALVAGSCGNGTGTDTFPVADTTQVADDQPEGDGAQTDALAMAAEVGDIDLSEDEARLVAVEAGWLCRAQRFSFGDPGEMTAARDELLAAKGVTADQYAAFTSELANRLELRKAVLAEFAAECLQKD